jgi:hypothetical protein
MNVHLVSSLENKIFDFSTAYIGQISEYIIIRRSSNTTGSNILEGFSTQKSWASWIVRKSDLKKKKQKIVLLLKEALSEHRAIISYWDVPKKIQCRYIQV